MTRTVLPALCELTLAGYFRGLEDEGPVRVSDVPEPAPSRNLPGRSR
jgi:hypothetical protein